MSDTAQADAPAETDRNAQIGNAANAFKAIDNPASVQPRDEQGQWTAEEEAQPEGGHIEEELEAEAEGEELDETEAEEDSDEALEADDSAQPLPPSWPDDRAEEWASLPVSTQQYLTERETEQTRALNGKFQEIANARKAAEAEARTEANAKRDELIQETERLQYAYQALAGTEPDPRAFGNNTQAYQQAYAQWQQNSQIAAQLEQQREQQVKEKAEAEAKDFTDWKQGIEQEWAPRLLDVAPELKDPARGGPFLQEMIGYATKNGIPEDVFSAENQTSITSPELLMIWKAMQYDKASAGKAKAKPKPMPSIRPGVSTPRSAQKATAAKKRRERLAREGSIEAGAAVFKDFMN